MEGANSEMSTLLSELGSVVTQFVSWISTVVGTITSTPLLLISYGVFVFGASIGLFRRLFGR